MHMILMNDPLTASLVYVHVRIIWTQWYTQKSNKYAELGIVRNDKKLNDDAIQEYVCERTIASRPP